MKKHVTLKDINFNFQTGIFINDWLCWMCHTDLDNKMRWNLFHSRLLFWESVHMSGWFSLNLSGTERRLMSEMLSQTANRNQVQWEKERPNNCAALRHKDSPLFTQNFKRHEINTPAVQSCSWEDDIQLVKIFYAFYIIQNLIIMETGRQYRQHPEADESCPHSVLNPSRIYIRPCNKLIKCFCLK
jgi:hypothetical protein